MFTNFLRDSPITMTISEFFSSLTVYSFIRVFPKNAGRAPRLTKFRGNPKGNSKQSGNCWGIWWIFKHCNSLFWKSTCNRNQWLYERGSCFCRRFYWFTQHGVTWSRPVWAMYALPAFGGISVYQLDHKGNIRARCLLHDRPRKIQVALQFLIWFGSLNK